MPTKDTYANIGPWKLNLDGDNPVADRDVMVYNATTGELDLESKDVASNPITRDHGTGITAFATGGQAGATALTNQWNNVTTCATAGDSVRLLPAALGVSQGVKNSGAADLDVFPSTGDAINALAANLAVRIPPGGQMWFRAIDATTFETNESFISPAPTTVSGGFQFLGSDNGGNFLVKFTNASHGQASTHSLPDPGGATGTVMLLEPAQTVAGVQTFSAANVHQAAELYTAGAAAAAIAMRFGASATEGLEVRVIDEVVATGAISNDLTEDVPDGAVILSAQGNVETGLTGGGTTTNYGIGPVADPDKYSPTVGALTLDSKADNIPDWAVLSGAEDIQVNGVTAGGALGDTALTVGTVRVRIVYLALNSLDNA